MRSLWCSSRCCWAASTLSISRQAAGPAALPSLLGEVLTAESLDEALARRYMDAGCLFTAVGADLGILARGAEALAAKFRNTV